MCALSQHQCGDLSTPQRVGKVALVPVQMHTILLQSSQHFLQVLKMLGFGLSCDQNVIQVAHHMGECLEE